jgi:glycerol-3-phosphate cytidylyltransferase-like family protein
MIIHEFYYNDDNRRLYVEFSTDDDGDTFYRVLNLGFEDIEYYSPDIVVEEDMEEIDEDFVKELITQYGKENDLPEEKTL